MIGLKAGISIAISVILCAALAVVGWGAHRAAERTIVPAMVAKAESVGRSAAALVESALAAGIPLDRLVGVDSYFDALRTANPELADIRLLDTDGRLRGHSGEPEADRPPQVRIPVAHHAATLAAAPVASPVAMLAITIDPGVISRQVNALLLDVGFIGIVALLVALELVALVVGTRGVEMLAAVEARVRALARGQLFLHTDPHGAAPAMVAPIDAQVAALHARHRAQRDAAEASGDRGALAALDAVARRTGVGVTRAVENRAAVMIRPALFLFMMAEELTRPFLPRFVQGLVPEGFALSLNVALALPIVVYMAGIALCQIPFAVASERLGRRRGFIIGAGIAALGYAGSGLTSDYGLFLAARVASAIGFALVFVSAQGHVVDHSTPTDRAVGLAVFVRAIMVAAVCGPPIGGVISDRLGSGNALLVCAGFALAALLVALFTLPRSQPRRAARGIGLGELKAALGAPRLLPLLAGCAFPAKILLAAICFYLVPVALQRQGFSASAIGRMQMIYPVLMVLLVPLFTALAERLKARAAFVVAGALVAGGGALLLLAGTSLPLVGLVLALLGVGQAMSIAPQSALVVDCSHHVPGGSPAGVLGLFRLIERSGNAAGPALAGVLLGSIGFAPATAAIGILVVAGALGFALSGGERHPTQPDPAGPPGEADTEGNPL